MLQSFALILIINYACQILMTLIGAPIPGTVIALVVLFFLLTSGLLKIDSVERAANVLLANMVILFLPPSLKLLEVYSLLGGQFIRIILLLTLTTILTLIVTAYTVQGTIRLQEARHERRNSK